MTDLPHLIRGELAELAGSRPLPAGFGDRVLAASRRRRRRRLVTGVAALATVGVVLSAGLAFAPGGSSSADRAAANAIFAYLGSDGGTPGPLRWHVLDPATGEYRIADVATVTAPSTTLRYAAVAPPWPGGVIGAGVSPEKKIGRYDTATGTIEWYDVHVTLGNEPRISPDGRYAVAAVENRSRPEEALRKLVLVDFDTGRVDLVNIDPATAAASMGTITAGPGFSWGVSHPGDGLNWHPDSRHLIIGNVIVDLAGRPTGTLPVPDNSLMVSVRPDGTGMLVELPPHMTVRIRTYALTDLSGALTSQVTLSLCARIKPAPPAIPGHPRELPSPTGGASYADPSPHTSSHPVPTGSGPATPRPGPTDEACWSSRNEFLGWRGTGTILVGSGSASLPSTIDAVDLTTGEQRTVYRSHEFWMAKTQLVIVPAEHLSDQARRRVGF